MEHIRLSEYAANVEVNKNSTPVLKAKSGLVQEPDHEIDEEFGMTKTKNPLQK